MAKCIIQELIKGLQLKLAGPKNIESRNKEIRLAIRRLQHLQNAVNVDDATFVSLDPVSELGAVFTLPPRVKTRGQMDKFITEVLKGTRATNLLKASGYRTLGYDVGATARNTTLTEYAEVLMMARKRLLGDKEVKVSKSRAPEDETENDGPTVTNSNSEETSSDAERLTRC